MRVSSRHRERRERRERRGQRAGALLFAGLAAGCLVAAAGPAQAVRAAPSSAQIECDPAGTLSLNPGSSVQSGGQVSVTWKASGISGCGYTVRMAGPGFNGDEAVSAGGNRLVTVTQAGPGQVTWTLSVQNSLGETMVAEESELVTTPPPPPSTTGDPGGATAFVAPDGRVTLLDADGSFPGSGPAAAILTRPAVARVGDAYEVAYQGDDRHLWVMNRFGTATDTGMIMRPATNPTITASDSSHFTVAFQADSTLLWTYSPETGGRSLGLAMAPGSSPSATLTSAGVAIAYVDENGHLSVHDPQGGYGGYGLDVADFSSPVITYILGSPDAYRIAYKRPDGQIWTADFSGAQGATPLVATAGSSPAITTLPDGEIDIAVNAPDGTVQYTSTTHPGIVHTVPDIHAHPGTSPAIAPTDGGTVVVAYATKDNQLHSYADGDLHVTYGSVCEGTSPSWAAKTGVAR